MDRDKAELMRLRWSQEEKWQLETLLTVKSKYWHFLLLKKQDFLLNSFHIHSSLR